MLRRLHARSKSVDINVELVDHPGGYETVADEFGVETTAATE